MTNMKPPQKGRNTGAPSLRGLQGRSATGLNGQAAKEEVSALWREGLDAGKYFWHSGRGKYFSLDIPSPRTWANNPCRINAGLAKFLVPATTAKARSTALIALLRCDAEHLRFHIGHQPRIRLPTSPWIEPPCEQRNPDEFD